jgi:hypothetical protein
MFGPTRDPGRHAKAALVPRLPDDLFPGDERQDGGSKPVHF